MYLAKKGKHLLSTLDLLYENEIWYVQYFPELWTFNKFALVKIAMRL